MKKNFFSARKVTCIDDVWRSLPDGWSARISGSTVPPYESQKQSTTVLNGQPCGLFFHPCMKHLRIRSVLMKSRHCLTSCINHAGIRFPVIMRSKQYGSSCQWQDPHYDDQLNYICSHNLSERKGSVNQLPEHRKQPPETGSRSWNVSAANGTAMTSSTSSME